MTSDAITSRPSERSKRRLSDDVHTMGKSFKRRTSSQGDDCPTRILDERWRGRRASSAGETAERSKAREETAEESVARSRARRASSVEEAPKQSRARRVSFADETVEQARARRAAFAEQIGDWSRARRASSNEETGERSRARKQNAMRRQGKGSTKMLLEDAFRSRRAAAEPRGTGGNRNIGAPASDDNSAGAATNRGQSAAYDEDSVVEFESEGDY